MTVEQSHSYKAHGIEVKVEDEGKPKILVSKWQNFASDSPQKPPSTTFSQPSEGCKTLTKKSKIDQQESPRHMSSSSKDNVPYTTLVVRHTKAQPKGYPVWYFSCKHHAEPGKYFDRLRNLAEWLPLHCDCRFATLFYPPLFMHSIERCCLPRVCLWASYSQNGLQRIPWSSCYFGFKSQTHGDSQGNNVELTRYEKQHRKFKGGWCLREISGEMERWILPSAFLHCV